MLDLRVLLERVERHVLAVAALLVTAVRHLVDQRDVGVDPHRAELKAASHPQRAADVACPDRGSKSVIDRVRPFESLVLVGELLNRDHGSENLALDDLRRRSGWEDDRRLVPGPGSLDAGASGCDLGPRLARALDEA